MRNSEFLSSNRVPCVIVLATLPISTSKPKASQRREDTSQVFAILNFVTLQLLCTGSSINWSSRDKNRKSEVIL